MKQHPYKYIEIDIVENIATLWFNRPEKHNALSIELINEFVDFLNKVENDLSIKAIVIRGKGKSFSSGADLEWFKKSINNSDSKNYKENQTLSECFHKLYYLNKPVISVVTGNALGGALGIICASDIALGTTSSKYAFSEVKLGLIPATISPVVVKRIGEFNSKYFMLTGKTFNGTTAKEMGLLNEVSKEDEIENILNQTLEHIKKAGPNALKKCKTMLNTVLNNQKEKEIIKYTIELIGELKSSEEGQEGMKAFLEKRTPSWIKQ